jgi:hypothetical protein
MVGYEDLHQGGRLVGEYFAGANSQSQKKGTGKQGTNEAKAENGGESRKHQLTKKKTWRAGLAPVQRRTISSSIRSSTETSVNVPR